MAQYVVRSGDTLSGIGQRLGIDWRGLTGYRSGNPNLIYPGEVLNYGAPAPPPPPAPAAPPAPNFSNVLSQATSLIAPGYDAQVSALSGRLPAISTLYKALGEQLGGQQQAANASVLSDANRRGVLYSTIPVAGRQATAAQANTQRAQLASQQSKEVGEVQSALGNISTSRANAIAQLVQALFGQSLNDQQIADQRALADRQYQLDLQRLNAGIY